VQRRRSQCLSKWLFQGLDWLPVGLANQFNVQNICCWIPSASAPRSTLSANQYQLPALLAVGFVNPARIFRGVVVPAAFGPKRKKFSRRQLPTNDVHRDQFAGNLHQVDQFDHAQAISQNRHLIIHPREVAGKLHAQNFLSVAQHAQ
jgi:hypothetical protein